MKKLVLMVLISSTVFATNKRVCGFDDRIPSNESKVGRTILYKGLEGLCTVTMISKRCAISAGHCYSILHGVEFNVPKSVDGFIVYANERDQYEIDRDSIKYSNGGPGDDWAVMKLKKNQLTGQYPGHYQGNYQISYKHRPLDTYLYIIGYGESSNPELTFTQQSDIGQLTSRNIGTKKYLQYQIDTMGGSSGASIVDYYSREIIGVHTHGSCFNGTGNTGTSIAANKKFSNAIKSCLASE